MIGDASAPTGNESPSFRGAEPYSERVFYPTDEIGPQHLLFPQDTLF